MTLAKDKKIKIGIFVEDDAVGGFYIMPNQYEANLKFIDAVRNNSIDKIVHFEKNGKIYELGSKFDTNSNTFDNKAKTIDVPIAGHIEFFGIISNGELVKIDRFDLPTLESFVAAYQSNPRFEVEEISINER